MTLIRMPSRTEIHKKLYDLNKKNITPDEASQWAMPWIIEETGYDNHVTDFVVWHGLGLLSIADAATSPEEYIYGAIDFKEWLKQFEDACMLNPLLGEQHAIEMPRKRVSQSSLRIQFPTRSDAHTRLKALANGSLHPNSASFWAMHYIMELDATDLDLEDSALSFGLRRLYWADMPSIESSRKFSHTDYAQWLQVFETSCAQNPIKE